MNTEDRQQHRDTILTSYREYRDTVEASAPLTRHRRKRVLFTKHCDRYYAEVLGEKL